MKRYCIVIAAALALLISCGKSGDNSGGQKSDSSSNGQQDQNGGAGKKDASDQEETVTFDQSAREQAGIKTINVSTRKVEEYLVAAGQIALNEDRTANIGTYTAGRVSDVFAQVGDVVRRGQILARMHSHDVHEVRAAYQTALESTIRQEDVLAYRQRMRDRMLRLYQLKSASKQEVERSETELQSARTELANSKIAVNREVAHLTDILHLPESALKNINETTEEVPAIASLTGTVISRMITPGAVVEPGQALFTISDVGSVWMMASVYEPDIAKVSVGKQARIVSAAYPNEVFPGTVTRLGTELDPKTRTLQVRIVVPNPERKLRIGMYVNARVLQQSVRHAIFIPETAIQEVNGGSVAFVHTGANKFEMRPLEIAHRLNGEAEIGAGLKPGESVVTQGSFIVKSEMLKSQIAQ